MTEQKSFAESTNSDNKEIGFQYQYYYFLYRLLNLKSGQSVGLEVKDDVHTNLDNDTQLLFQLKHSVQRNSTGNIIALTELDHDLWKTLYNWTMVISDKVYERENDEKQLAFIAKTEFHLVTNKSESKSNNFLIRLLEFQNGTINFDILYEHIKYLQSKTQDEKIKQYIGCVLHLSSNVVQYFFSHIYLEMNIDDVFSLIKSSIREKMVDEDKVKHVFERLDSNIRKDNFIIVKTGDKIEIDFDSFQKNIDRFLFPLERLYVCQGTLHQRSPMMFCHKNSYSN
ncbi:hypothetical protein [Kosakonia radicincitans]|uniref:hypothetical protein n=1 Tax=Kosakonia radicincitans TaxID=283686 RepID=UPI001D0694A7|nr:hypothetical protein [Kosakonia radicincitans]